MILGGFVIAGTNIGMAVFDQSNENLLLLISVLALVAITSMVQEPVFSLYQTEVCNNSGLGLVNFVQFGLNTTVSFAMPFIVNNLGPVYMYYFFGGIQLGGTILNYFTIKETAHLTDKEKKALYSGKASEVESVPKSEFRKSLMADAEASMNKKGTND